jgi:hypothetical protein
MPSHPFRTKHTSKTITNDGIALHLSFAPCTFVLSNYIIPLLKKLLKPLLHPRQNFWK